MIESPLIAELLANAKAEALLRVLQKRYRQLPEELTAAIRTCPDSARLDHWLDAAGEAESLERFRQQAGL